MGTPSNAIEVEADKIRTHFASALTDPPLATQRGSDEWPRVEQSVEFHQRVVEARTPNREGRDRGNQACAANRVRVTRCR
jgi:hypothetical protein